MLDAPTKTATVRVVARNVKAIAALQPESTRVHWRVKGEKGLVLTIHPNGERAWAFRAEQTGSGGKRKQTFQTLGSYRTMRLEAAIKAADDLRTKISDGSSASTLNDLFALWLEQHAKPKLATWEMEESRYKRQLQPALGTKRMSEIERKDVREIRDLVSESSGPIESNRAVGLFSRIANWAVDEDHAKFNPAAKLKKTDTMSAKQKLRPCPLSLVAFMMP